MPFAIVAALIIGIPSDIIDTPIFGRPVALKTIDYVIWAVSSALIGFIFAIRVEPANQLDGKDGAGAAEDNKPLVGGFVSFLAVGCPVCNQLVVALVGTSGALSWWAPVQPIVGLVAIAILLFALKRRLETYDLQACPLPDATKPTTMTGRAR